MRRLRCVRDYRSGAVCDEGSLRRRPQPVAGAGQTAGMRDAADRLCERDAITRCRAFECARVVMIQEVLSRGHFLAARHGLGLVPGRRFRPPVPLHGACP